jgi:hypothetical protein
MNVYRNTIDDLFSTEAKIKEFISYLTVIQIACISKSESVIAVFQELKVLDFLKLCLLEIRKWTQGAGLLDMTDSEVMNDTDILNLILISLSELFAALFDMPLETIGDQTFLFDILGDLDYKEANQRILAEFISQIIRDLGKSASFNLDTITTFNQAELMKRILDWVQENMRQNNIEKASLLFSLIIQLLKVC